MIVSFWYFLTLHVITCLLLQVGNTVIQMHHIDYPQINVDYITSTIL